MKSRGLRENEGAPGSPSVGRMPSLTQVYQVFPSQNHLCILSKKLLSIYDCLLKSVMALSKSFLYLAEDVDPSVGRFRNMVQTAVIPIKVIFFNCSHLRPCFKEESLNGKEVCFCLVLAVPLKTAFLVSQNGLQIAF